jgi:hypothetical protein
VFLVVTRRYNDDGDGLGANAWQVTGGTVSTAPFVAVAWVGGGSRLATAGAAWMACIAVLLCGQPAADPAVRTVAEPSAMAESAAGAPSTRAGDQA